MRRSILLVAVMITGVLVAASAMAYAQQSTTSEKQPVTIENHSWENYHWAHTSNPFTLKLGDNVNSTWDPYLKTTSSDWSKSNVLDTTIVAGRVTKLRRCAPLRGRVEVCNTRYGNNGWLGVAGIYVTGDHITKGYVKLNDTYFNTSRYNTPAWRNLVMCQEVGHILGLDHTNENFDNANGGTCMDYSSDPDGPPSNEHPNQHDYDQLETIYAHLDSTTTVGASTAGRVPPGDLNTPSGWGRSVFRTADGRVEFFERDVGPGARGEREKLLTWVRWTEAEAKRQAHTTGPRGGSTTADFPVPETTGPKGGSTTATP